METPNAINETKQIETEQTAEKTPVIVETASTESRHEVMECDANATESVEMQIVESEVNQQVETTSAEKSEILAEKNEQSDALQVDKIEINISDDKEIKTETASINDTSLQIQASDNLKELGDKETTNAEEKLEEKIGEDIELNPAEEIQPPNEEVILTPKIVEDANTEQEIKPIENVIQNNESVQSIPEIAEEQSKQEVVEKEEAKEIQVEVETTNNSDLVETNVPIEQEQLQTDNVEETDIAQPEENQSVENKQIETEIVEEIQNDENKLFQEGKSNEVEANTENAENSETPAAVSAEMQANITLETEIVEKEIVNQIEEPVVQAEQEEEKSESIVQTEQEVEIAEPVVQVVQESEKQEPVAQTEQEVEKSESIIQAEQEVEKVEPVVQVVQESEKSVPVVVNEQAQNSEKGNDKIDSNDAAEHAEEQPVEVKKPKSNTGKAHRGRPKRKQQMDIIPSTESAAEHSVEKPEIVETIQNDQDIQEGSVQVEANAQVAENAQTQTAVCIETQSNITMETAEIEKEIVNQAEEPVVEEEKSETTSVHVEEQPIEEKKPKGNLFLKREV